MKKSKEELLAMSHEELADYTMTLQAYYLIASEASNKRLQENYDSLLKKQCR